MNNVRDFGAVGDGIHKDTAAIQKAIDAGGTVYFPAGTYLSGTIYLKSGTGLELDPGAVLLASPDPEDYNADDFCPQNRVFAFEHVSGAHFITAVEKHNISIRGGRIDGGRQAFFGGKTEEGNCWKFELGKWRPGQMIFLCECENVTLENVELYNAPYWTCFLHGCEQVNIHALRIWNDSRTPNGDGIDIDCCRFVTVSDCIIDSGDDCITLRGWSAPLKKKRACEYITVSNCILSTNCNGLRIGVGDGLVRFCNLSNLVFHHTRHAVCIVSNYIGKDNAVQIEDIVLNGLIVEAQKAIVIKSSNTGPDSGAVCKPVRRISICNMHGKVTEGSCIAGMPDSPVEDISLSGIHLTYSGGEYLTADDGFWRRKSMPMEYRPAALFADCTRNVSLQDVRFRWENAADAWKYGLLAERSAGITLENSNTGKPDSF